MERSGILLLPDDSVWNRKAAEAAEKEGKMAKKVLVVDDEKLIVKGIRFRFASQASCPSEGTPVTASIPASARANSQQAEVRGSASAKA